MFIQALREAKPADRPGSGAMIAGPPTGSSAAALLARGVCRALDQLGSRYDRSLINGL
jgi:hypothetical protein